MSEAASAVLNRPDVRQEASPRPQENAAGTVPNPISELRVSGHLMSLEAGLFCIFQAAGTPAPDPLTGLPGVRVTLAPGQSARPEAVSITTFRKDGWLDGTAALVRVTDGTAQVLVTIYQTARPTDAAPRLQVLRLSADQAAAPEAAPPVVVAEPEIVAHVQRTGDLGAKFGDWIGTRGSKLWIEGFGIAPTGELSPADIEYQAVLGRGWLSPWVEGGKFCGSRGMALPLLGLKVRLTGDAAKRFDCSYSATFVDGSAVGPVASGETCEADSLAALEAFQIEIHPRGTKPVVERKPVARTVKPKTSARTSRR